MSFDDIMHAIGKAEPLRQSIAEPLLSELRSMNAKLSQVNETLVHIELLMRAYFKLEQ